MTSTPSEAIQKHLDKGGERYLDSINDTRAESTIAMMDRLSPLLQYVSDGDTVVSIGVGSGEELCGVYELFGDAVKIVGVDISPLAIQKAQTRVKRNHFSTEFVETDATTLPFADESISAIILSSTLHEVYSYHSDGIDAVQKVLTEVSRVLKPDGIVFIRDFAISDTNDQVTVHVRTPIAMKFYEYFSATFKKYSNWDNALDGKKVNGEYLPPLGHGTVHMPQGKAAELLMHFRSFWSDFQSGIMSLNDPNWKEIDEEYILARDDSHLTPNEFRAFVESALGGRFTKMLDKMRYRNQTNAFLNKHFVVECKKDGITVDCIPELSRKLECVYQKDARIKRQNSAAVIFNADGKFLMCKRSMKKKIAPGAWHLPGGRIESDENPIETITKELNEELLLKARTVIPTKVTSTYPAHDGLHQTHFFYVEVENQPTIANEENDSFEFISLSELSNYLESHLIDDNVAAIKAAAYLGGINL